MTGRRILCWLLWRSGLAAAARRALVRGGRFVVTFHGIASRRYPGLPPGARTPFTAADLADAVGWIAGRFRLLDPEEFLAGESAGVLLTFDDGFANNCTNALPVLEAYRAPAIFFVTAQHVREPRDWLPSARRQAAALWGEGARVPEEIAGDLFDGMSRRQLASCAEHPLVTVGSHTVHHPFLTRCDDSALARELGRSRSLLEEWCGHGIDLFAYPTGDYDLRVARAVRDAGYRAAFVEDPAEVGMPAYEIPRIGVYDSHPAYLAAKLSGLHRPPLPPQRIAAAAGEDGPGKASAGAR